MFKIRILTWQKMLNLWFRIRIRIFLSCWVQKDKNDPPRWDKVKKFHVLKCWIFSFENYFSSGVLYGGVGISKLHIFYRKMLSFFAAVKFVQFLVIKTLDSELDPNPDLDQDPQLGKNCWIRILIKSNPKHWLNPLVKTQHRVSLLFPWNFPESR